jgi:hypothetical protein
MSHSPKLVQVDPLDEMKRALSQFPRSSFIELKNQKEFRNVLLNIIAELKESPVDVHDLDEALLLDPAQYTIESQDVLNTLQELDLLLQKLSSS